MDFRELHALNVVLAKKLEVHWFFSPTAQGLMHSMPFLSRNLSYIRMAKGNYNRKRRVTTAGENGKLSEKHRKRNRQQRNLLFELFNHRTVFYNDALLSSPRRQTRGSKKAEARCASTVVSTQKRKRKRSNEQMDETSVDSAVDSPDDSSVAPKSGEKQNKRTWTEKLPGRTSRVAKQACNSACAADSLVSVSPLAKSDSGLSSGTLLLSLDKSGVYRSSTAMAETPMFIYFLVLGRIGVPAVHVQSSTDRRCPFCYHDAISDTGLVLHLNASHGENAMFRSARSETGELHVACTAMSPGPQLSGDRASLKNFVCLGRPTVSLPTVPFAKCHQRKVASLDLATRNKKIRLLEEMGANDSLPRSFVPTDEVPIRQYFRSKTYQPMVGGDWEVDSDEDSTADQWVEAINSSLLDDFSDLSSNEKSFMKLWNQSLRSHVVISDRSMPERSMAFIRSHFSELNANDLRSELVLHMHNLWDTGLVSCDHVVECMMAYDSLVSPTEGGKRGARGAS